MKVIFTINGKEYSSPSIDDPKFIESSAMLREYSLGFPDDSFFYIPINYECDFEITRSFNSKLLRYMLGEYLLIDEDSFYRNLAKIFYSLRCSEKELKKCALLLPDNDIKMRFISLGERYITITSNKKIFPSKLPIEKRASSLLTRDLLQLLPKMHDFCGIVLKSLDNEGMLQSTKKMMLHKEIFELLYLMNQSNLTKSNSYLSTVRRMFFDKELYLLKSLSSEESVFTIEVLNRYSRDAIYISNIHDLLEICDIIFDAIKNSYKFKIKFPGSKEAFMGISLERFYSPHLPKDYNNERHFNEIFLIVFRKANLEEEGREYLSFTD